MIEPPSHLGMLEAPPVSVPMHNVINMLAQYFFVYAAIAALQIYSESAREKSTLEHMLQQGEPSLDLIPMLAVLFLACRFRALEVRPQTGEVSSSMQTAMYIVAYSVLTQTLACVL